jgi:hypothetical protein
LLVEAAGGYFGAPRVAERGRQSRRTDMAKKKKAAKGKKKMRDLSVKKGGSVKGGAKMREF